MSGTVKKRRRKVKKLRVAVFVFIVILLIAIIVAAVIIIQGPTSSQAAGGERAVFGVSKITVEGLTRYPEAEVVEKSGFYIGQSMMLVNKNKAIDAIMKEFPYVRSAIVSTPAFGHVRITINEETPICVVRMTDDAWMVTAETGKGVEKMDTQQAGESGYLKVLTGKLGTQTDDGDSASKEITEVKAGEIVLPERQFEALNTLLAAFEEYELSDILEIDMSAMTDIRLDYGGKIEILMGNDSNLHKEIGIAVRALEKVFTERGKDTDGRLDISSYSDGNLDNDRAYFTPGYLVNDGGDTDEGGDDGNDE